MSPRPPARSRPGTGATVEDWEAERARKAQKTAEKKARSRARTWLARETRAIEMRTREALGDRLAWLERYEVDGRVIRNPGDLTGWDDVADMTAPELYALAAWGEALTAAHRNQSEQYQALAEAASVGGAT